MVQNSNLRLKQVKEITGLSASTIWRLEKENLFPKRRKISRRAVAWQASAVQTWLENQFKSQESQ